MTKKLKSIWKMVFRPTETCFEPFALSFQNRISGFPTMRPVDRSMSELAIWHTLICSLRNVLVLTSAFRGHFELHRTTSTLGKSVAAERLISIPSPRFATFGKVTGSFPWIGISPKSARTMAVSEVETELKAQA